jgi:hypothetical protein
MTSVVISPSRVADFPDGGGHFWVYMQYVQGLRALGCDVYWLEHFEGTNDAQRDEIALRTFLTRMCQFDLAGKVMINRPDQPFPAADDANGLVITGKSAEEACARADLLLNFSYSVEADLLARFSKTALIDIDPGLLQFWISQGQVHVASHDLYFSTGETVGKEDALFSDCDISWQRLRPIVSLRDWPLAYRPDAQALTTISGWWGDEWISNGEDILYQNNKRVSFMEFVELAARTEQTLELALGLGIKDPNDLEEVRLLNDAKMTGCIDYQGDAADRATLEAQGWKIRLATEVAATPEDYRYYIQRSRGEFSCAKPSCMKFQNAWVSDRSLCFMASGKPVIVQDTGPSEFLPHAEGMFRFKTVDEALAAIDAMNADYHSHCMAARELAETYFDAEKELAALLDIALSAGSVRIQNS